MAKEYKDPRVPTRQEKKADDAGLAEPKRGSQRAPRKKMRHGKCPGCGNEIPYERWIKNEEKGRYWRHHYVRLPTCKRCWRMVPQDLRSEWDKMKNMENKLRALEKKKGSRIARSDYPEYLKDFFKQHEAKYGFFSGLQGRVRRWCAENMDFNGNLKFTRDFDER